MVKNNLSKLLLPPSYMLAQDIYKIKNRKSNNLFIKLCSNESPLGANPKIINCLQEKLDEIHLYPDVEGFNLKYAISNKLKINIEQIILGNGSTEILDLIAQAFIKPNMSAIISEYGYPLYEFLVKKMGGNIIKIPVKDWQYNLDSMLHHSNKYTKIIFLTNPNNPTSSWITHKNLINFLESINKNILVVIDEAYYEYLASQPNYSSAVILLRKYQNLIIVRTFSKAYGLAGLRIGYATAASDIINKLKRIKQSANVNTLAQYAAVEAINDHNYIESLLLMVNQERKFLMNNLAERGINFLPSLTNFILINLKQSGLFIYNKLKKYNILVHPMDYYNLPNSIRVSIGAPSDNKKFISVLSEVLSE